jgi:hypothetical protein
MAYPVEQQEELDVVCAIFDDAWTTPAAATGNALLHVPVPYLDGAATLVIELPAAYLVAPGVLPRVTIEGMAAPAARELCSQLAKAGLVSEDGAHTGDGTQQVLFEVVTRVRDALGASIVKDTELSPDLTAEADVEAEAEAPDWRVYEAKKEAAAIDAKHDSRARPEPADPTTASPGDAKLYGKDAYIARLKAGGSVSFREGGNSMTPRIKSRQLCTFAPVLSHEDVSEGDAVFCKVGGAYYTHLVVRKELVRRGDADEYRFQIGNNHGHVNGWTTLDKVFGRVVAIAP